MITKKRTRSTEIQFISFADEGKGRAVQWRAVNERPAEIPGLLPLQAAGISFPFPFPLEEKIKEMEITVRP